MAITCLSLPACSLSPPYAVCDMRDTLLLSSQVKAIFDNQLQQLENLIATQRKTQAKMLEQKASTDERYRQVMLTDSQIAVLI